MSPRQSNGSKRVGEGEGVCMRPFRGLKSVSALVHDWAF